MIVTTDLPSALRLSDCTSFLGVNGHTFFFNKYFMVMDHVVMDGMEQRLTSWTEQIETNSLGKIIEAYLNRTPGHVP